MSKVKFHETTPLSQRQRGDTLKDGQPQGKTKGENTMIKLISDKKYIDPEGWDFPFEELDYLMEEHDDETFVIKDDRLFETFTEHIEEGSSDDKWADTYEVLKMYSKILINEYYSNFDTDAMVSLKYFYDRYEELEKQTFHELEIEPVLCTDWDELKRDIIDNIETLVNGSIGL